MSQTMMSQKQMKLAITAQENPAYRFTNLYSLMHWDYWINCAAQAVLARPGSSTAGIDGTTRDNFKKNYENEILKLIESLKDKTYEPQPVRRAYIPKSNGKMRPLGIPILRDRIVQEALRAILDPIYEADFRSCSYGFRKRRCTMDAIAVIMSLTNSKLRYYYVIEGDIKSYFDTVHHRKLLSILKKRIADKDIIDLIWKFLKAGVMEDGLFARTETGVPQGGVVSPVLANLFMHYVFDEWMRREHPNNPWARYADDAVIHCRTQKEAKSLLIDLVERFKQCKLELNTEKTRIVYCKDDDRKGNYPLTSFDFLGYTFRPRRSKNRWGKCFINFSPAVSNAASKAMRQTIRGWRIQLKSDVGIDDLSRMFNPVVRGWINYYGCFYKSQLYSVLRHMNRALMYWARRKYKKLAVHKRRSSSWLGRLARNRPELFAHWQMGILPTVG